MKRILLGTAVVLALLTGCTEEKKETPAQKTEVAPVAEVKKEVESATKVVEEVKKEAEAAATQVVEDVKKEDEATEEKKEETK
ncbi:MAG: hypothetical protein PHE16_00860 [Aliarcobacter sp.]|nr:hypothetical protein [Aliarcobacter sp.]